MKGTLASRIDRRIAVQWSLPADQVAVTADVNGFRNQGGSIPTEKVEWRGRSWRVALHYPTETTAAVVLYVCAHDPAEVAENEPELLLLAREMMTAGSARAIETIEAKAIRLAVEAGLRAGISGEHIRALVTQAIREWGGFGS